MKFLRVMPVIALVAVIAVPGRTAAAPAARSSIPTLAGKTTATATNSAYIRVHLPIAVHYEQIDVVELVGDGRAVGFALVKERNGRVRKNAAILEAVRFGDCFEEACATDYPFDAWGAGGTGPTPGKSLYPVYPPGIYRLYLIADGAPATVTLEFSELTGETTITPTTPARALVQNLTPRLPVGPTRSLYSAGDVAPFRGHGLTYMFQKIEAPGNGTAIYDACIYWDEPPAQEATAYLPPDCPKGMPQGHRPTIKEYNDQDEEHLGYQVGIYALPAAIGNWYATTTPADVGGSVAVWLKF